MARRPLNFVVYNKAVMRSLDAAARNLNEQGLTRVLDKAALIVENEAKQLCPVDTGTLRASIHTEKRGKNARIVRAGTDYAEYVEFGSARTPAQPFLRPAL